MIETTSKSKSKVIPPRELQRAGKLLLAHQWIYAKTMPESPHEYTLRREWKDDAAFLTVVQAIRQYGYVEIYKRRPYTMLNVNGDKYWTMGAPLPATILINRKDVTIDGAPPSPYDAVAEVYDKAFSDRESLVENQAVADLIGDVCTLNVLDIGCGTGLFLDYLTPSHYTGIDPSSKMLEQLRRKHPEQVDRTIICKLEEYVGTGFDLVVSLFGAVNYIHPRHVAAIPTRCRPGGRWFIMCYKPGYRPVCYDRTGVTIPHYEGVHEALPGARLAFGNFIIVEGRR